MNQEPDIFSGADALTRLRVLSTSLSPAEGKVCKYILENPTKVIRMTLIEIAEQTGVSDATAVRFARSAGYKSWLDLKISLVQTLPPSAELIYDSIDINDSPGTIARKVIQGSQQALEDTLAILVDSAIEKTVNLLAQARNILIAGVGTSGPMAHEMYNRLLRLGLSCQVQTDSYLQIMQTSLLTVRDVLVIISQTGDSYDPLRTASEARLAGVPVVCITGNQYSPITEYADVVLFSMSQESMPETVSSRIAQYALIHALYVSLALRSMDQSIRNEQIIWKALMRKAPFQSRDM